MNEVFATIDGLVFLEAFARSEVDFLATARATSAAFVSAQTQRETHHKQCVCTHKEANFCARFKAVAVANVADVAEYL